MATRTRINAAHIIATQNNEHRHLRDGVVVYEGDRIIHVGKSFDGNADQTIDLPRGVVTPGFINTHAHLAGSPLDKSFIEDVGPRQFYGSGLFEYLPVRGGAQDAEADIACLAFSMAELLRSGTTTIMEMAKTSSSRPGTPASPMRVTTRPKARPPPRMRQSVGRRSLVSSFTSSAPLAEMAGMTRPARNTVS